MKSRNAYHEALVGLSRLIGEGRFGWGRPLVVTDLASSLRLSATPVREAMARLSGEGLIEHRSGQGYFARSPTASDIVDLYELRRRLIHWTIDILPSGYRSSGTAAATPSDAETVYSALVSSAGNPTLSRAYRRVANELRPVQKVEAQVAPVPIYQIVQQDRLLARGDLAAFRLAVDVFHLDRSSAAQSVFSFMRQSSERIETI